MTCEEYVELATVYIKEKDWKRALGVLGEAQRHLSKRPAQGVRTQLLSTFGLCLAMGGNNIAKGIKYCEQAVAIEPYQPRFYYHLGMVYLRGSKKQMALAAFFKGSRIDPDHPGIKDQLRKLGERRGPLLSFLPRKHILNKTLGKLVVANKR